MTPSATFTHYWQGWALVTFSAFLIVEIVALCTNWRNTLSANVWRALQVYAGQPVGQWTVWHFLAAGVYVVITVWLFGHFFMHWWTM